MKSTTKAGFFLFTLTCLLNMFTRVSAVRMTMKSAFVTGTRSYKVDSTIKKKRAQVVRRADRNRSTDQDTPK